MTHVWADDGYADVVETGLVDYACDELDLHLEIVRRCDRNRFVVLPKRWIVERTLAWISRNRRLARDYERHARKAAAFVRLAMIRLMLRRLASNR